MKLLLLDNYDSFTYNLVHLIQSVQPMHIDVIRNDKISIADVNTYDKILLSPGPGVPKDAGIMPELIQTYKTNKSILGICLGMQAIGEAFGAELYNLPKVYHGKQSRIKIEKADLLYHYCPQEFMVGRYHSWAVAKNSIGSELNITASTEDETIMSLAHKHYDVRGVQYHPESFLSEHGKTIISNWINN